MTDPESLVDEGALEAYLDAHFGNHHAIEVRRHLAGHSNETFFVARAGREYVLRRPPRGAFLPSAHDVGREFLVLDSLAHTPARVPRTVMNCSDDSIIGAPFYLMERLAGEVIRTALPEYFDETDRTVIAWEVVDALVELHTIDPQSCGLGDFGKPTGYLQRQLRRWPGQLELTLPLTRPLPELERTGSWLGGNVPGSPATTIVHGDYKLDNLLFAPRSPARLVAILDWEMSTLGDPLADLGWMISFWREPDDPADDVLGRLNHVTAMPGFPNRQALIERYSEATGFDTHALDWYRVLAMWKLAILLEGSYARHLAGATDDPFFGEMEYGVPALARRAAEVIGRS